jgi:hypothetical protein
MNYSELVPVLVSAIQEQQGQIEDQDKRIADLEARLSALESAQLEGGAGLGWKNELNRFWLGGIAFVAVLSIAGRRWTRRRS